MSIRLRLLFVTVALNIDISEVEITKAINELKHNKSSGADILKNELFMFGKNNLSVHLISLFNFVFDSGIIPSELSEGC